MVILLIYMNMLSDAEEAKCFEEIYQSNHLKMYYVALSILKNPSHAEDAVHNAFVKIIESFSKFRYLPCREITSLCVIITKNKSIDIYRRLKVMKEDDFYEEEYAIASQVKEPLQQYVEGEEQRDLRRQLSELSEPLRIVLELKYYHGLKNAEIAKLLDLPIKTIEMRLYRAKSKLREVITYEE